MKGKQPGKQPQAPRRKKPGKSLFRRINDFLHLWLGLISGLVVFIVSITGCIYAFEKEIRNLTEPFQFAAVRTQAYLPPSRLKAIAEAHQFGAKAGQEGKKIEGLQYPGPGKAAVATYRDKQKGYTMIYMDPYSGQVLKVKELEKDFFRFILKGHFNLWLPRPVGQQIVCWSIGIFIILLITGLIMWWPKNLKKANRDKSFTIKWKASFKRVNYDLHNVPGFYTLIPALIIAITGIYFGFQWVPKTLYWVASGGQTMPDRRSRAVSDTTYILPAIPPGGTAEDKIWTQLAQEHNNQGSLQIQFALKPADAIVMTHNPREGTFYQTYTRYFDRYTLKELPAKSIFAKPYDQATAADKVIRMNYDIHIGAIGGITGKILAFLISLVCASLPVTGFIIWWGKKRKSKPAKKSIATGMAIKRPALQEA